MWKQVRINTKTGDIKISEMKPQHQLLGGRSLIAQILTEEVDPKCDPLGPQNKLILCTGTLAGTNAATAHRMSVGGKSPLTGGIKESNVGGTAANYLAGHGLKMLVFEDQPEELEWKLLFIDKKGEVSLLPAADWIGLNNYEVVKKAEETYGKDVSVASIGLSGELGYLIAGIGVTEYQTLHPCRLAARGGMGTLMGSKGIKAVIMEKPETRYQVEMADPEGFAAASKEFTQFLAGIAKNSPYHNVGTVANIAATAPMAVLPVRNFSGGYCADHKKIGAEVFMKNLAERGGSNKKPCQPGCPIRCSNIYHDEKGEFLTAGFEYETLGLCGSNLEIDDLDVIARIDRFCDDMGMDSIEIGVTLGVCMEAGKIPWGNAEAVFGLLDEMKQGTEFGRILGQGAQRCGEYLGCKRIPAVKGQAIAAYEPRNLKGTGITYSISTQGGDHTAGVTLGPKYDASTKYAQLFLSKTMQTMCTAADSCMCLFAFALGGMKRLDLVAAMHASLYGVEYGPNHILGGAVKNLMLERAFNKAAGFTDKDDQLPEFFYNEPSPATGAVFDFTPEETLGIYNFV